MAVKTLTIDGKLVSAREDQTILEAAREAGIAIPTLCHLDGLSDVGACRLCLVEVDGRSRLLPACVTKVAEGMDVQTDTDRLREYRRMIVELLFAERNHVCSVCVANGHCELQDLAIAVGMDHVRFDYLNPACAVDVSHERFGIDHNRCILCTRCVRVCDEIEGAHTWDVAGRGTQRPRHHRPEPALGRRRRPAPRAASASRPARPARSSARARPSPRWSATAAVLAFLVTAREKKQWNV